ncbi:MAG: hypothetical protein JXA24_07415 [Proteobacteria bacterium]|nr:hypothetical protein [Pseudomonadota bacterium]
MSDDIKTLGPHRHLRPMNDGAAASAGDPPSVGDAGADNHERVEPPTEFVESQSALQRHVMGHDHNVFSRIRAVHTYTELSAHFTDASPEIRLGAATLRRLMRDPDVDMQRLAVHAYGSLFQRFKGCPPEIRSGLQELLGLMGNPDTGLRILAAEACAKLSANLRHNSPEVHALAAALRRLMEDSTTNARREATQAYKALASRLPHGDPEVYEAAAALRRMMTETEGAVRFSAADAYKELTAKFLEGSSEVYEEASALRRMMEDPRDDVRKHAAESYAILSEKFAGTSAKIGEEADAILGIHQRRPAQLKDLLKGSFHHLSHIGFFKAGFESGAWLDRLGLTRQAVHNLRGFAQQPGYIDFRDSVIMTLDFLSRLDDDRRLVASRILESTDPAKWKSVRNTVSTLRLLSTIDSLPESVGDQFYLANRDVEGDPRALLRSDVGAALLSFLRGKIDEVGASAMVFMAEAPDGPANTLKQRGAQEIRRYLSNKGLIGLFAQSASFMEDEGLRILKSLLGELAESRIKEGRLLYQKRYDRMVERLGFSPKFVALWSREWERQHGTTGEAADAQAARVMAMGQAAAQLSAHVASTRGSEGRFVDLPDRMRALACMLERGEVDIGDLRLLHEMMELGYAKIRETYGDLFANARVDLKNLLTGLTRGVKSAKTTAYTEITGLVEKIAFHGSIPTETCQRLSSLYSKNTNGRGQPLNKLIWGQFRLANHVIDGEVVARRMLEVTLDGQGLEHLLAERPYIAGGFAGLADLDADILEHAQSIGITADRVHFLDRHEMRRIPAPLATGALIYRDSGLSEIEPALTMPFRPFARTAMVMPKISAATMFRTVR